MIGKIYTSMLLVSFAYSSTSLAGNALPDYFSQPGTSAPREYAVDISGTENIDPISGGLNLSYQDLVIPGNGGLDIVVTRSYQLETNVFADLPLQRYLGMGWDMHFGRMLRNGDSCTTIRSDTRDNPVLQTPDGSRHIFYLPPASNSSGLAKSDLPGSPDWISKDKYLAWCKPYSYERNGIPYNVMGYEVLGPDGTTYTFDRSVVIDGVQQFVVSRIDDKYGNWLQFTFLEEPFLTDWLVDTITSRDGRHVSFEYADQNSNHPRLTAVQGGTQRIAYSYQTPLLGHYQLVSVDGPANIRWRYEYSSNAGLGKNRIKKVTTPNEGTVTYDYGTVDRTAWGLAVPTIGVSTKTINTRDIASDNGIWRYRYYHEAGSILDFTEITRPDNSREIHKFCGLKAIASAHDDGSGIDPIGDDCTGMSEGALVEKLIINPGSSIPVEIERMTWGGVLVSKQLLRYPNLLVTFNGVYSRELLQRSVTRDGVTHTSTFVNFDKFGNPGGRIEYIGEPFPYGASVTVSSDLRRDTLLTYNNNVTEWVVKRVKSELTYEHFSHPGIVNTFNSLGDVSRVEKYGVATTYAYNSDGTVRSITDARANVTQYSNYYRGVARREDYPEGVSVTREVDVNGYVTSETNGRGLTTGYGRDALGRVTSINTSRGDDNNVSVMYSIPDGLGSHGRRLIRGEFEEKNYVDGFGQVTKHEVDSITKEYQYDALGRKTFESYPNKPDQGEAFQYDALGRVVKQTHTADGSYVAYEYSQDDSGFYSVTKVTNELGNVTEYTYRAFSSPNDQQLIEVRQPEGIVTRMTRTKRGDLLSVTQGDGSEEGSQTRTFVYNNKFFLDYSQHPEIGRMDLTYDAVGNVTATQVFPEVGAASAVTRYQYDKLNRVVLTDYPVGTDDIRYTYDATGNVKTLSKSISVWSYDYNNANNIIKESLSIDDKVFQLEYTYNANDALASIKYPSGLLVDYAPNNLGWPTQVGSFAQNISYHANGSVAGYLLANGLQTSFGQNQRLLADSIQVPGVVDLTHSFDEANNLIAITDGIDGEHSVSMSYDGVHRLIEANGRWGVGAFSYNEQGNLTSKQIGSSIASYSYSRCVFGRCVKTANLQTVSGDVVRDYSYDVYGNVTSDNGARNFNYDSASNLVSVSGIKFVYDGNNRRVKKQNAGRNVYSVYNKAGILMYEIDGINITMTDYVHLGGQVLAKREQVCEPDEPDTDGDGLLDCVERLIGFDPLDARDGERDDDGDGLSNTEEYANHTSFTDADTDHDGIPDGYEVANGLNPIEDDAFDDLDDDGLSNFKEFQLGSNPAAVDTDGDGIHDKYEVDNDLDILSNDADEDKDDDALTNLQEFLLTTRANLADTDADGLNDGREVNEIGTDPLRKDTDKDGMPDGYEVNNELKPLIDDALEDKDGDGFVNIHEYSVGTDPSDADDFPKIGSSLWKHIAGAGTYDPVAVGSNYNLYLVAENDYEAGLYAYRLNGELRWHFPVTKSLSAVSVDANSVSYFAGEQDGKPYLFALSPFEDESQLPKREMLSPVLLWQAELPDHVNVLGAPSIDVDGNIYITLNAEESESQIMAFDQSGKVRWRYLSPEPLNTAVAIGRDNSLFVGASVNGQRQFAVLALNATDGSMRWRYAAQKLEYIGEYSRPGLTIAPNGVIYANSGGGSIHAVSWTGHPLWVYDRESINSTPVLGVDGVIYATAGCYLLAINPDGRLSWSDCLPFLDGVDPAINAESSIFVPSYDGGIYKFFPDGLVDWFLQPWGSTRDYPLPMTLTNIGIAITPFKDMSIRAITVTPGIIDPKTWSMHGANPQQTSMPRHICGYADRDDDGLPDCYELLMGTDPDKASDAREDADWDGLDNLGEYRHDTRIDNSDTDGDGLADGYEVDHGMNPLSSDTDGDGLDDAEEERLHTNPINADSDGDGMDDGYEVKYGLAPLLNDAADDLDGDGTINLIEFRYKTAANDPNSYPCSWCAYRVSPASISDVGDLGNQHSALNVNPSISDSGRYLAFVSDATNLVADITPTDRGVYLRDFVEEKTHLVSVNVSGDGAGNGRSDSPMISGDGRFVAFVSTASDLTLLADTNGKQDIFLRDLEANTTQLVTHNFLGNASATNESSLKAISADGRYVLFSSRDNDLVADDTNGQQDFFIYDRVTDTNAVVSVNDVGELSNQQNGTASMSADGQYVVFTSQASNLVTDDTNGRDDIFIRDLQNATTRRVSLGADGQEANASSYNPRVSADGQFVVFESSATNLDSADVSGSSDIFIRDLVNNTTRLVSRGLSGLSTGNSNSLQTFTDDGNYVAFQSASNGYVVDDTNGRNDIFVYNRVEDSLSLVSVNSSGTGVGDNESRAPRITADGRYIAFTSRAENLLDDFSFDVSSQVFVRDVLKRETFLASPSILGKQGSAASVSDLVVAKNAPYIGFASRADDLLVDENHSQTQAVRSGPVPVSPQPLGVTLIIDLASPQASGARMQLRAEVQEPPAEVEYQFLIKGPSTGNLWRILRNFDALASVEWDSTGLTGRYVLQVRARTQGSTPDKTVSDRSVFWLNGVNPTTSVNLTTDLESPQSSGAIITLTAQASEGSGSYEYQFRSRSSEPDATWQVLQEFSPSNTVTWDTRGLLGKHRLQVRARNLGSGDLWVQTGRVFWLNDTNPATSVSLVSDTTSPLLIGGLVTLTAQGDGGSGSYDYQFRIKAAVDPEDAWQVLRDFAPGNSLVWDSSAYPGRNLLQVLARNTGSQDYWVEARQVLWVNQLNPASSVTLASDTASPLIAGSLVTLTAQGSGGSDSYDYQFRIKAAVDPEDAWQVLRDFAPDNSLVWDSSAYPGRNVLQVLARNAGSQDFWVEARQVLWVNQANPVTSVRLTGSPASPILSGQSVTFTAQGEGGDGSYEYQYRRKGPLADDSWQILRDYTSNPSYTWDSSGLSGQQQIQVLSRKPGTDDQAVSTSRRYQVN